MGIIRGGALFLVGTLLLVSLIAGNFFIMAGLSLEYETLEPNLIEFIDGSNFFEVPSSNLTYFVEEIYYKDYNCDFLDCISDQDKLTVYVSETAKNFWMKSFYYSLIISLILLVLVFLLITPKKGIFTLSGILLIVSSLPVFAIGWLISNTSEFPLALISLAVSRANTISLISFFIGLVLILFGFSFKFWSLGYKFYEKNKDETSREKNFIKEVVPKNKLSKKINKKPKADKDIKLKK